ncbi:hypothetical protein Glove_16g162 [Diversispora epigaea]|uniref:Uncharacterized protein n=1 Tax=Diversispora epigaea TaxID=1348612 RepID=A0A397JXZ1_9GLOM|nr:hypothetical protein Glove_16g162 [Diversispora epigaea]
MSLILALLLFFIKGSYKVTNDFNKANNFILETGKITRKVNSWKESEEKISCVVSEILGTLEDIWNNSALTSEMAKTLNEGTYQSTVIVLTIQTVLKNLPLGSLSFISISERQSIASADRRGTGRRPDIMFIIEYLDVFFELMYIECSQLLCTEQKKVNDDIKLWRECNDGMYYTRKTLNLDKDQFKIIEVQIAGDTLHLNVFIRDKTNLEAKHGEYAKLKAETAKLKTENTKLLKRIIKEYVKNEADIAKLKTGLQYQILFERIKAIILELEIRNAILRPNRKFQDKCIQIAEEILNEEPIIEYRPPFLNGLEFDAFFQKYQIALEVQGNIKKLEGIINRNRLKRCICQDNGIFLLEVWYDEKPERVILERIQKIKCFVNQASQIFDL